MKYHKSENATFRGGVPTWANACVGENGNPQIFEYASGFASAANVLLNEVIKRRGFELYVDVFVYPICFNMRHAVELFLKGAVNHLAQLASICSKKIPAFDIAKSHDLGRIWSHVKENAIAADKRYASLINSLEEYVVDIAKIDSTGQVFRYPFDVDNQKHLTDLAVINLALLKKRFNFLEARLRELNRLSETLIDEYGWGTFTPNLSRAQLIEVASLLPSRKNWGEAEFNKKKTELKARYEIGSKEFSQALNLIQQRHKIAALIGVEVPIPDLDFEGLKSFFDNWLKIHDIEEIKNPPIPSFEGVDHEKFSFEKMGEWHDNRMKCRDAVIQDLSPNCFASIRALFNFHRESPYSEVFDRLLLEFRAEAGRYMRDPSQYKKDVMHLLDKTNALEGVLNSLNFFGRKDLMNSIFSTYGLNDAKPRILESSEILKRRLIGHLA